MCTSENDILRLVRFGIPNPYVKCPVLETKHFRLRLVKREDAADLLECYSDPVAQEFFNADNCTSDFCYQTAAEMEACIEGWLGAYEVQAYVRYAIVDKSSEKAVGTVEMFGGIGLFQTPEGVLRLDICSGYENQECLEELFSICATDFFLLFEAEQIITKAVPGAEQRITVLKKLNFRPVEIPGRKYCWVLNRE